MLLAFLCKTSILHFLLQVLPWCNWWNSPPLPFLTPPPPSATSLVRGLSWESGRPTSDHILKGNWLFLLEKPSIACRSSARGGTSEFPFSMLECLQVWIFSGLIQGLCRLHSYYGFMRTGYHVKKALKNKCHMFSSMCGYWHWFPSF